MSSTRSSRPSQSYIEAADELRRNREQWQAYESTGNFLVLAGPGSGKTKVLTTKMARMLGEDITPPQGVACITYNNECARELTRRLSKLRVREARHVFIGTVHSFCLRHILKPYAKIADTTLPHPFRVAGDRVQQVVLQRAMDQVLGYEVPIPEFRPRFDRYRRTLLDRSHADWRSRDPEVAAVVELYEKLLHERGFIDFDDMSLVGVRLLMEQEWIRRGIRCRFPILVVDEYQDLGVALHEMVVTLLKTGVRVFAVGDPDQSIYGFAGANPKLVEDLTHMDGVESTRLKLNYRSRKSIVDGSQIVLREDRGYEPAPNEDATDEDGVIEFVECPEGLDQQAEVALAQIIPGALRAREGRQLGDIAILYQNRNIGDVVAGAAAARRIPVVRIDRGAPYPKTPITRWLEDCAAWCAGGWLKGEPALSSILTWWSTFTASGSNEQARWQAKVRLVAFLWRARDPKMLLSSWLETLWNTVALDALATDSERQDEIDVLQRLREECSAGRQLAGWTVGMFAGQVGDPGHLNLMTLHSCKGLEFHVVVMIGMDQGIIPSWADASEAAKREPRRLFYVGMTRAKHEVYMAYSGFTVDRYERRHENGPSEFLLELQEALRRP